VDTIGEWLRRHWWVVAVLVVTVGGTYARGHQVHHATPGAWAGVLAFLAVAPLLVRDSRPELTVLANGAVVAAYFAFDLPDGPVYLSVLLSTFALTSRRPPRQWLPYAGGALLAILVARGSQELANGTVSFWQAAGWVTWLVALDAAFAAVGMSTRNRRETRAEQARRAATEERLRMARDLHDGVGHGLAVIAMQAGVALHVLERDPTAARRSLEAIRDTSKESLDALRAELVRLSPAGVDAPPLAPRNGLADLPVLADRIAAGGVEVVLAGAARPVSPEVDAVAYVVVQESLTNVLRHADATRAEVTLRHDGATLEVVVTDNGRVTDDGATNDGPTAASGMGIPGMRARVVALGGSLDAGPADGGGFRVRAELPLDAGDRG
jgi:signal transduction histidine kinase